MNINFELVLFYAALVTGIFALADVLYFAPKRARASSKKTVPLVMDYARSFFPILLLVFCFRSFFWEPFRIPSGSLEPTLLVGDFILVNKFDYGIRLPVWHKKIYAIHEPKRGDIIIFRWPPNPSYDFIKRVIGVPGDHISYINKVLSVNGQVIPEEELQSMTVTNGLGRDEAVLQKEENLLGVKHRILINPERASEDYRDIIVPPEMYFVMGDNRDDSADSRYWGFVADRDIIGKGALVWMSWGGMKEGVRFKRLFQVIH